MSPSHIGDGSGLIMQKLVLLTLEVNLGNSRLFPRKMAYCWFFISNVRTVIPFCFFAFCCLTLLFFKFYLFNINPHNAKRGFGVLG